MITDVAVCVLSLVKAFGAVFFLLCLLCVIVLSIFALVDRHSRYKATGKLMGKVGELTGIPTDDIEVEQSREDYGPMVLSLVALPAIVSCWRLSAYWVYFGDSVRIFTTA